MSKLTTTSSSSTMTINVPTQIEPRSTLTSAQEQTLNKFILEVKELNLEPKLQSYCSEACLIRYLKARDWDLKKSMKLIKSSIEWRRTSKPEAIFASDLTAQAISGKIFRRGVDQKGRPVIYMTPARENSTDYEKNLQLIVYTVERAIDSMGPNVEQLVLVVDFNDFSKKVQPPISVCKEMINIMSNHYPERLGGCYIVDAPFIFNVLWKAISPFINSATRAKVHFVRGNDDKQKEFSKFFDMTTLEQRFGGSLQFQFTEEFWRVEVEVDDKRKQRLIELEEGDATNLTPRMFSSKIEADAEVPSTPTSDE